MSADEQADLEQVNAVGDTGFFTNGERAQAGGWVPTLEKFPNASEMGKKYIQEWKKIRDTVPPLYFDGFSPLLFDEYTWNIWEKYLVYGDAFDEMDDRSMIMGLRTVYIDSQIKQAIALGTKQVVQLGVGLDTKSMRLQSPEVACFEVDEKPVLSYKTKKLAKAGYPVYPAKLIFGNYLEIDVFAELEKAGLDMSAPTLFVWEGNTMYLSPEDQEKLLGKIFEKVPKATVTFDSILPEGDPTCDVFVQRFYDVMNGGKCMWPGRTDPETLATKVGAKLLNTIRMKDFMVQVLGSEEALKPYVGNNATREKFFLSFAGVMYFNSIAKSGVRKEQTACCA